VNAENGETSSEGEDDGEERTESFGKRGMKKRRE
jgi:hypothetical protein